MDRPTEPFWNQAFRDDARPFGPPSAEVHLLPRPERDRLIRRVMHRTRMDGWNIMAVFTTTIEPPPDLARTSALSASLR